MPLFRLHLVAFRCISYRLRGRWGWGCTWGFTLILTFSPQGRRDLQGQGCEVPVFTGIPHVGLTTHTTTGDRRRGVNPGPIWPCLALFTPTVEVGMRPPWPWLASSGVARSDETFKTVSFGLIPSHSSRRPGLGVQPHPCIQGTGDASFPRRRGTMGGPLLHAYGGAIPGVERPSGVRRSGKLLILFRFVPFRSISESSEPTLTLALSQRARGPDIHTRAAGMRGSRLRGNDERSAHE